MTPPTTKASNLRCSKPINMPKLLAFPVPCRVCSNCIRRRRREWYNRLLLESYGKNYKPLFGTLTYDQAHYSDNPSFVLRETQKFFKRLRRKSVDLRYFMAIERGSANNRLHNHFIIFSQALYEKDYLTRYQLIKETWGNGIVDVQEIRSPGGLLYTTKYLTKNQDDLSTLDHMDNYDRRTGKAKKRGRLYTYSQRDMLGTPGLDRWKYLITKANIYDKYTVHNPPVNWFYVNFLGKQLKAYIPKDNYLRFVKSQFDINFQELYKESSDEVRKWLVTDVDKDVPVGVPFSELPEAIYIKNTSHSQ